MIEALTIDATSTIHLLESLEALYCARAHPCFLDNAKLYHACQDGAGMTRPARVPDQAAHERSASNALDAWRVAE